MEMHIHKDYGLCLAERKGNKITYFLYSEIYFPEKFSNLGLKHKSAENYLLTKIRYK